MADTETDLNDYVESLYKTDNFEQAFTVFERYAYKSGLDGVFYIYIPRFPLDNGSPCKPAFNVSHNLNPACISHLFDNGFDQPEQPESSHFNAPFNGGIELIEWQKKSCTNCQQIESHATSESTAANSIGIANGIAIKLMSGEKGIAIAGFVRCHSQFGNKNQKQIIDKLVLCAKLFHSMVISSLCHIDHFLSPILNALNNTEKSFLQKLAQGKSLIQISHELGKSEKYLDRVMLRIRQKLSGVSADELPKINRNQVLYYAGLLNIFDRE